jgi:hypothetical protein
MGLDDHEDSRNGSRGFTERQPQDRTIDSMTCALPVSHAETLPSNITAFKTIDRNEAPR